MIEGYPEVFGFVYSWNWATEESDRGWKNWLTPCERNSRAFGRVNFNPPSLEPIPEGFGCKLEALSGEDWTSAGGVNASIVRKHGCTHTSVEWDIVGVQREKDGT